MRSNEVVERHGSRAHWFNGTTTPCSPFYASSYIAFHEGGMERSAGRTHAVERSLNRRSRRNDRKLTNDGGFGYRQTSSTPIARVFSFPKKATEDKGRGPTHDARPISKKIKVKPIAYVNRLPSPAVRSSRTPRRDTSSSSETSPYENANFNNDSDGNKFTVVGRHRGRASQRLPGRTEVNRKAVENSYSKLREYLTLLQQADSSSTSSRTSSCPHRQYASFTTASSSTPSSSSYSPSRSSSSATLALSSDSSASSCRTPSVTPSFSAQSLALSSDSSSSISSRPETIIAGPSPPTFAQIVPSSPSPPPPPPPPPCPSPSVSHRPVPSSKTPQTRRWRHRLQTLFPCLRK
ncbi:hypothetical protein SprV_0902756400 [Sparganum proliferum]